MFSCCCCAVGLDSPHLATDHLRGTPPPPPDRSKFRAFFPLFRPIFELFAISLGVFSLNFGGVFESRDSQMYTFGFSSCRVKHRRLRSRKGCTQYAENSKRAQCQALALQKHNQNSTKGCQERDKKERKWGGRGTKCEILGLPRFRIERFGATMFSMTFGPHPSVRHLLESSPIPDPDFWANNFWPHH